jgi:hypothetical protein
MPVYVDNLRTYPNGKGFWRGRPSCHLFADTLEEMHYFAKLLDLRKSWFQNHPRLPHYDLTGPRRDAALKAGAIPVGRTSMVYFMRHGIHGNLTSKQKENTNDQRQTANRVDEDAVQT